MSDCGRQTQVEAFELCECVPVSAALLKWKLRPVGHLSHPRLCIMSCCWWWSWMKVVHFWKSFHSVLASCMLLSLCCTSSFTLSIHHFLCLPRLFVPSVLVRDARIGNLLLFVKMTIWWPGVVTGRSLRNGQNRWQHWCVWEPWMWLQQQPLIAALHHHHYRRRHVLVVSRPRPRQPPCLWIMFRHQFNSRPWLSQFSHSSMLDMLM